MKKYFIFLVIVLWMSALSVAPALASPPADRLVVVLIVDNSGSMETSDPADLRYTGVRLFASLLDSNDLFGLIIFSTQAEVLTNELVALNAQDKNVDVLKNIKIPDARGYTDVKSALESAQRLIENSSLGDEKVVLVLLTDGKPEIQNPYPRYEQETLDLARLLSFPIIAIALTSSAQTPFLDQLADATKGMVVPANDSSDLLDAYLQILGQIKDRTVIGGTKFNTATSLEIEQALAPYVNSATFIIAKPEKTKSRLLNPDGTEVADDVSTDAQYSLFTLENPAGGVYSFRSQGKGEMQVWGILRSRLRVQFVSPAIVHPSGREMDIVVNLLEEKSQGKFTRIIGEVNFTALITGPDDKETSLDRFYDDGTHGDLTANDGDYTRTYPDTKLEGTYRIAVEGWKGAIPVKAETSVNVLPFPEIAVDFPLQDVEVRGEPLELRVHLQGADALDRGHVVALISSPSGDVQELEMQGNSIYTGKFLPLESGEYHITFETRDAVYRGVEYQTKVEHSFGVTVIPFVRVVMKEINVPAACLSKPDEVVVSLTVNSSDESVLHFSTSDRWKVTPEALKIKKGAQDIELSVFAVDGLNDDVNGMKLFIEGEGKLEVQPDAVIEIEFQVPVVWARCRTPIQLGGFIFAFVIVGGVSIHRKRKAAHPLPVSGTLRHWEIGKNPTLADEIDLTTFDKHALLIGSGATCDVMIPHADLAPEHARVMTEKIPDGVEMILEPIGEVRKGYHQQIARFTLRHAETFRMGAHEFQYLSDSGN